MRAVPDEAKKQEKFAPPPSIKNTVAPINEVLVIISRMPWTKIRVNTLAQLENNVHQK